MYVVVGLGNPGARYARTRHNAGFLVIDRLSARWSIPVGRRQFGADLGDGSASGSRIALVKPQQYMNVSGQPVASILGYYKVPVDKLIVVQDDLDLPSGRLRVRPGGGAGGHNGIKDIQRLIPGDFLRVRVGIGRPPEGQVAADYVLSPLSAAELAELDPALDAAADSVESVLTRGLEATMNQYNTSLTTPKPKPSALIQ